jgi:hypothetical protein
VDTDFEIAASFEEKAAGCRLLAAGGERCSYVSAGGRYIFSKAVSFELRAASGKSCLAASLWLQDEKGIF